MFDDARVQELTDERLEAEVATLYSRISAETCRWLGLVAELDRREAYARWGCRTCADWLSWHCGVGLRAAREQVRVARRLAELPAVRAAFGRGELSYSKVRALTRVMETDGDADLLELAHQTTAAQLERIVRGYSRALEAVDPQVALDARDARWGWDENGCLTISARLPADEGAVLVRALEAARDELSSERGPEAWEAERQSPREARPPARTTRADALVRVAEHSLAGGDATRSGGDATQVVVHVDAESLSAAELRPGQRSEIDDGPALPAEVARRLACDTGAVGMLERAGEPLAIGRKTRTISPALRRALGARDRGCRFPGCTAERFIDAHHIQHWARGGKTELRNLVSVCRHHHRLLHEGGFQVIGHPDGRMTFTRPDGRELETAPRLPTTPDSRLRPVSPRPRRGFDPLAPCGATENNGRLDLHLTVWCLLQPARRAQRAARSP